MHWIEVCGTVNGRKVVILDIYFSGKTIAASASKIRRMEIPLGKESVVMKKVALLTVFLMGLAVTARATTIGPTGCGSCLGSSYTLTYETSTNPDIFFVFLKVDTSQFSNPPTDTLKAVALKLTSSASDLLGPPVLIGSPIPSGFGTTVDNGLNANGCAGGVDGYFCSAATGNGLAVGGSADVYTFEWQVQVTNPSLFLVTGDSVKAEYLDSMGKHNGLTSEDISDTQINPTGPPPPPIPEPSSLLLL